MDEKEIAMQITLKAMETGHLLRHGHKDTMEANEVTGSSQFNAKTIAEFYNLVLENIKPQS